MLKPKRVRLPALCAALLIVVILAAAAPDRVVAIGDIHGDFADFNAILRRTGLIDNKNSWAGGGTLLVQVGDVVDRGPKSRECLDLLMALERQARRQNGKVIALLGNHEVMAMTGDLRYVSAEDYQGFATEHSEKVREDAYRDYLDFVSQRNRARDAAVEEVPREEWMHDHPPGFFERRDAFSPQGVYGRWLRQHDAIAQIGDVLYVHGGLNPEAPVDDIRELNQKVRSDLVTFDSLWQSLSKKKIIWKYMKIEEALRQAEGEWKALQAGGQADPELKKELQRLLGFSTWFVNSPDSPVWYRGLALEPEEKLKAGVDAMLERLKIGCIVAGHTPQADSKINVRFGNHVLLIDTGMVFGGRASALEMRGGRFTAYYANEKPEILPPAAAKNSVLRSNPNLDGPKP